MEYAQKIAKNHRRLVCDSCNNSVHITCNLTDTKSYERILRDNVSIFCLKCQRENIPFQSLTDLDFIATSKALKTDTKVLLDYSIKSTNLKTFFKSMNNSNPCRMYDKEEEDATLIDCKYVDLCSFDYKPKQNQFSIFIPILDLLLNIKMNFKMSLQH